jgi:deoxyribodipyrimidine photo-lyase
MISIVWFKRDLRIRDHTPLKKAIEKGLPILAVYLVEPKSTTKEEFDFRHMKFAFDCAADVQLHIPLQILYRDAVSFFQAVLKKYKIDGVYSYCETGVAWTYERDRELTQLLRYHNVNWHEFQNGGVQRGRSNRTDWDQQWRRFMQTPLDTPDLKQAIWVNDGPGTFMPEGIATSLKSDTPFQKGGEAYALERLNAFIDQQGYLMYQKHISKPIASRDSCSRLSPYLAWGAISIRQVYQRSMKVYLSNPPGKRALQAFISRLHWHCHFVQKFEMEDRMEFENLNRGFDAIRYDVDDDLVNAWKNGLTGVPMIDASMRCVKATGYLNFRMRAMLVSFLTHQLWQPWNSGVHHLAQCFTDFEPGIHFPQFQMQAGTTGINQFRIYNPVKQGQDHDSDGSFVRQWIPEIASLPNELIHTPWKMTPIERLWTPIDYPLPVVDIENSARHARDTLFAYSKNNPLVRAENYRILMRHTTAIRDVNHRRTEITKDD